MIFGLTRGHEADRFLRALSLTGERHEPTNTVQVQVPLAQGGHVFGWIAADDLAEAFGW